MSKQERCPTCISESKDTRYCICGERLKWMGGNDDRHRECSDPWHDSAPSSKSHDVATCICNYEDCPKCRAVNALRDSSSVAPTEYDPELVDGEGNPVEVGVSPLLSSGKQFNEFVTKWEHKNGSAHHRPYTFAIDYASSVAEQPQPIKWKRQESCPECDGDGCANCTVEQPSREQAVQADTLLGVFTSGDGAIAAKMFKELTPATVWEGMNRIADYVNRRPREQAVEGLVEALAAKARELLDEFVRARRVHHLDAADFRDAFKPVVAHYEASRGERQ